MKIFLDTSVFIWAYNHPKSNSAQIFKLANNKQIEAAISENVLIELKRYFGTYHDERTVYEVEALITEKYEIIPKQQIEAEMQKWHGKIKEKDLEHLATVKHLKIDTLVAFDRDYEPFPEYITPKQFLKKLGIKTSETEY
ncbi:MAG: type II toxin-antitoxin system VapC family toxin [Candidatus Micrarchaeota archaeon]